MSQVFLISLPHLKSHPTHLPTLFESRVLAVGETEVSFFVFDIRKELQKHIVCFALSLPCEVDKDEVLFIIQYTLGKV